MVHSLYLTAFRKKLEYCTQKGALVVQVKLAARGCFECITHRHVNVGWALQFANFVRDSIPQVTVIQRNQPFYHAFLKYEGRFYDAQCHDGVNDWLDLPIYHGEDISIPSITSAYWDRFPELSRDNLTHVIQSMMPLMVLIMSNNYIGNETLTAQHINNGFCAEFAQRVKSEFHNASELNIVTDEQLYGCDYSHTFLEFDGLYYDAECPQGVSDWTQLPIFADEAREVVW